MYENLVSYNISLPENKKFIVRAEYADIPLFIMHSLKYAFPEYKIIIDDKKSPNLVVRNVYQPKGITLKEQYKHRVPYLSYSPEKKALKYRRYRVTGYPFFEFVTHKTQNDNMVYIPFASYHRNNLTFLDSKPRAKISLQEIKKRRNIVYVFRHCVGIREKFFKLLAAKIPLVDSHGKCSKNVKGDYPKDLNKLYSNYKFVIAMENAQKDGYITEKIVNAYESNAIPIYWGDSKEAKKYFNPKSFIDLNEFKDLSEAVDYINRLINHPVKIQQILAEPILTAEGEKLLTINQEKLNPEAEKKLREIAVQLRKQYMQKITQKNIFLRIKERLKELFYNFKNKEFKLL